MPWPFRPLYFPAIKLWVRDLWHGKMAATTSHPLLTKSIHRDPKGSIQMVDYTTDGAASMHAIQRSCAFHKSEKHSDSDCRAQQESATSTTSTAKKRPKGSAKKKTNSVD